MMNDNHDPVRRRAELESILDEHFKTPRDRSDAVIAWTCGLLLAFLVAASAIVTAANIRDDVRATRRAVERIPPCRP